MKRFLVLSVTHSVMLAVGFALGIYLLPILTAPASPDQAALQEMAQNATYTAEFTRDLPGSDFLHWGEGAVSLTPTQIVHEGRLSPGPDYKLYLVDAFVQHEDDFLPIQGDALMIGSVKTFEGFILDLPEGVDLEAYTTVLIWCESFSEFITAAKYR
ncbi:MAG: DM13 domain-containing protein [Paracoccaceae bacterium]